MSVPGDRGFSLIEVVIATGLTLLVTASIFAMVHPVQGAFAAQPEVADMQQRLRVGAETLSKVLLMAGAGAQQGPQAGPLTYFFPSVLPFRQGAANDDPPGTFAGDRITIIYVPSTTAHATLSASLSGTATTFTPVAASDCPIDPALSNLCGFAKDQTVLIYDDGGSYNLLTIAAVAESTGTLTVNKPDDATATTFAAGSTIVEAASHTYFLKTDVSKNTSQLMHYDGTTNNDLPVVDNVVALSFEYYGEAQPPIVRKSLSDIPATTYGPKPSAVAVAPWGAFENCLFSPGAVPTPKLPVLGAGTPALVRLTPAQLTDGPFCPDDSNANRWDADLLRIRKVGVTLRVQSAVAALRGPAGVLFSHGGTSAGGARWAPDQELHFDITPRNLNLGR